MRNAILNSDTHKEGFNAAIVKLDNTITKAEEDVGAFETLSKKMKTNYNTLLQIQWRLNMLNKISELTNSFGGQ
jgi:hypothetical protein